MSLRIAHFSDIHLTAKRLRLRKRDWLGKRSTGWFNAKMGRGRHFVDASTIAGVMVRDIKAQAFDHVIFSGDATTLGLSSEFEEVRRVLTPDEGWPSRIAVPGNHDYYTPSAARGGEFERVFASWQEGERINGHVYPFAQKIGPLWLIAVNSAQANVFHWDSRGRVGRRQMERLETLLKQLPPGPRVMVTHYPLCLADGQNEIRWRRLRDAHKLRDLCQAFNVKLWLHGHRHVGYFRTVDLSLPFPVVCAGSATQAKKWSYNEYTFVDGKMHGRRRVWSPEAGGFVDGDDFSLPFTLDG